MVEREWTHELLPNVYFIGYLTKKRLIKDMHLTSVYTTADKSFTEALEWRHEHAVRLMWIFVKNWLENISMCILKQQLQLSYGPRQT